MAFRPETAVHLRALAEALLRGPSPLTSAERESIAAFVSSRNDCTFCYLSHRAAAAHHDGGDYTFVDAVTKGRGDERISPKLRALLDAPVVRVNSMHHQGIKTLAAGLRPTAVAPDGLIEGLESPNGHFVLGVQWHPEALVERDPRMQRLFASFIEEAAR